MKKAFTLLSVLMVTTVLLSFPLTAPAPPSTAWQPSYTGYKNVGFDDFYSQLGVDTSFDLKKIEPGQSVEGVVKDVELLKKAGGPEGVKNGDTVIFHHFGDGKFRLSFPRLENKNTLDIKFK